MRTLVIDFNCTFASTLGRVLERAGYRVHVAATPLLAVEILRQRHFDLILIDSYGPHVASQAILEEIYTRGPSKVYVMSDVPALATAPDTCCEEKMLIVQATAAAVLSIVRKTRDSAVALVAGFRASKELARTLLEEGYPTVVTHDISSAARLFFEGTYPVVFLQSGVPVLAGPDQFAVLHTLTARSLAVLALDQPAGDLRCGIKPRRIAEVTQILRELQEESGKPDQAMSLSL